jgi:hypothetical protein
MVHLFKLIIKGEEFRSVPTNLLGLSALLDLKKALVEVIIILRFHPNLVNLVVVGSYE